MKYILSLLLLLTTSLIAGENSSSTQPAEKEPPTLTKAREIVIQELTFSDLSLQDALRVLNEKAREADKDANKGVTVTESGKPSEARLTFAFLDIPLDQAITYFAKASKRKVIFEDDVVKLVPQGE